MIGDAQLQYHPSFFDDVQKIVEATAEDKDAKNKRLGGGMRKMKKKGKKKSKKQCDPANIELLDYPQWEAEKGYWIGEYTFLKEDGNAFVSSSWNYPYDHYKGFITGEVSG